MSTPRTPREFADAGMVILVACRCGHEQTIDPLMVEFTHGEHFDLAKDWRELVASLRCEACGTPRPIVSFGKPRNSEDVPLSTLKLAVAARR